MPFSLINDKGWFLLFREFRIGMSILPYLKWITNKDLLGHVPNGMWQPGWEGNLGENGYRDMYGWVLLLFIWNYHTLLIGCVLCCAVLSLFSHVRLFGTLWTVALQASLSMGILQARILEWVAVPFSREYSWPRDQTCVSKVSCVGRQALYHWRHMGSPLIGYTTVENKK